MGRVSLLVVATDTFSPLVFWFDAFPIHHKMHIIKFYCGSAVVLSILPPPPPPHLCSCPLALVHFSHTSIKVVCPTVRPSVHQPLFIKGVAEERSCPIPISIPKTNQGSHCLRNLCSPYLLPPSLTVLCPLPFAT